MSKEDGKGRNVVSSLFKSCPPHTLDVLDR